MQYQYTDNDNYEDFASGRVLYGGSKIPNFPVRLSGEIFGRCMEYSNKKEALSVYDPCCGGGYSLTVLGFLYTDRIACLIGSDIDENMTAYAEKNTGLLTKNGMDERIAQIKEMIELYGKESHREALESAYRLKSKIKEDIRTEIFVADCTKQIKPEISPDIIITDIPYGNLVSWGGETQDPLHRMLDVLAGISEKGTVLAVSMDKKQKPIHEAWSRVERQLIGKRKFEIFVRRSDKVGEDHGTDNCDHAG